MTKVEEFKYLGSVVQGKRDCTKEVKKRVQAGWNGRRKVSGVIYIKRIYAKVKEKIYKTVVSPAVACDLETERQGLIPRAC